MNKSYIYFLILLQLSNITILQNPQFTPIPNSELPKDFPQFKIEGETIIKTDFFMTAKYIDKQKYGNYSYVFLMNHKGEILKYRKAWIPELTLIHYNSQGKRRYTYFQKIQDLYTSYMGADPNELIILDENFELIQTVRMLQLEDIMNWTPLTHDYLYLDDNHFILVSLYWISTTPDFAIQEQKDNQVIFHWQSDRIPNFRKFSNYPDDHDWAHFNSIKIDKDNNIVISCRSIGILKINRQTGEIMWGIGRFINTFNLDYKYLPYLQHDATVHPDGSILVWDNSGSNLNYSRGLRYFIDEKTMKVINTREYLYKSRGGRSPMMGSFQILDDERDIVAITYGGVQGNSYSTSYEEFDFKKSLSIMRFKFKNGHPMYRVIRIYE